MANSIYFRTREKLPIYYDEELQCIEAPAQINIDNVAEVKSSGLSGLFLARKFDGSVWAWGDNGSGQVGNGTFTKISPFKVTTPVQSLAGTGNAVIEAGFHGGFSVIPSFATNEGENIQIYGENISLNFSKVDKSGITSYTSIDPKTLKNFTKFTVRQNAPAYKFATSAETSGDIEVCLKVKSEYDEKRFGVLRILQQEDDSLVDKTSASNY